MATTTTNDTPETSETSPALSPGAMVEVHSLKLRPEDNGKLGRVVKFEQQSLRYHVALMGITARVVLVKGDNLKLADPEAVDAKRRETLQSLRPKQLCRLLKMRDEEDPAATHEHLVEAAVKAGLDASDAFEQPTQGRASPARNGSPKKTTSRKEDGEENGDDEEEEDENGGESTGMIPVQRQTDANRLSQMREQANMLERMSVEQMRQQLREFRMNTPTALRLKSPSLRNVSDEQIFQQRDLLEAFIRNPRFRRTKIRNMKNGIEFDPNNDDDCIETAKIQLAYFRRDPAGARRQFAFQDPTIANLTDSEIEAKISKQLNPEEFRREAKGDVSSMPPDQIKKMIRAQLDLLNRDPREYRRLVEPQNPDIKNVSDADLKTQLEAQLGMSDDDLKMQASIAAKMRKSGAVGGKKGGGGKSGAKKKLDPEEFMGELTEEEMKYQIDMQIKLLKSDPAKFRETIRAQDPAAYAQVAAMTDEQLIQQLEAQRNLDPSTIKEMRAMQMEAKKSGGTTPVVPKSAGDIFSMDPVQVQKMMKIQYNIYKKDPAKFREVAPQFAALPDSIVESTLKMFSETDPDQLRQYFSWGRFVRDRIYPHYQRLDDVTGGYARYIAGALMLLLTLFLVYGIFRIIGWLFSTIFSLFGGASTTSTTSSAAGQGGGAQFVPLQQQQQQQQHRAGGGEDRIDLNAVKDEEDEWATGADGL